MNCEGESTPDECRKLETLVDESEKLMVANARRLAEFTRQATCAATDAIPVTIWGRAEKTEP